MFDPFKVAIAEARPSGLLVDGATANDRKVMRAGAAHWPIFSAIASRTMRTISST